MADLTKLAIPELNRQVKYYTRLVDSGRTSSAYAENATALVEDLKEELILRSFKTISRSKQNVVLDKLGQIVSSVTAAVTPANLSEEQVKGGSCPRCGSKTVFAVPQKWVPAGMINYECAMCHEGWRKPKT